MLSCCAESACLVQSKLAESEEKVAALTLQIEHLHNDRLRLENRNSVLEKVYAQLHCVCKHSDCTGLLTAYAQIGTHHLDVQYQGHQPAKPSHCMTQVLEMKETEDAKPAASSSGKQTSLLIRMQCAAQQLAYMHPFAIALSMLHLRRSNLYVWHMDNKLLF